MYLIKSESGQTFETMDLTFVRFNKENGDPYGCSREEAQGFEGEGTVYRMIDRVDIDERYEKAEYEERPNTTIFEALTKKAEKNAADIDYIAMMAGIVMEEV